MTEMPNGMPGTSAPAYLIGVPAAAAFGSRQVTTSVNHGAKRLLGLEEGSTG
jgi:hypothetical protein